MNKICHDSKSKVNKKKVWGGRKATSSIFQEAK